MSIYTRRFLADPGNAVLLNIESVNILDLTPPANIQGIGAGTVLLVGEFENGPYNTPQQLLGATDLVRTWGTLGYTQGSLQCQYPSAPVRYADGAIAPEYWNGNAFVQISGLTFATLLLVRVDTSVGAVSFAPLAYVEGAQEFAYTLASGQELQLSLSSQSTFVTAAATLPQTTITVESTVGFPSTGGTIVIDGATITYTGTTATTFTGCVGGTVAMSVGDTVLLGNATTTIAVGSDGVTLPAAIVHVASTVGFPTTGSFTVDGSTVEYTGTTTTTFTGCTGGTATLTTSDPVAGTVNETTAAATFTGNAAVVSGTGATYPVTLSGGATLTLAYDGNPNFTVTFASGTYTAAQIASIINAQAGFTFASVVSTQLVLTGRVQGSNGSVQVVGGATATALGLPTGTVVSSGSNVANILAVQFLEIQKVVQNAVSGTRVELNASGELRISNTTYPNTGAILIGSGTTALGLGFTNGEANSASASMGGTLPAGTVVSDAANLTVLVTTQDLVIPADGTGVFSARVRFAIDNGTGVGVGSAVINTVQSAPSIGSFAVTNPLPITNALTESQIDAAYAKAIATTTDINTVSKVANIIVSARQSNTVRSQLRQNVLYASANGCYGRMACISPPLNTAPQVALSNLAAPGVGATRDQRVIYCYVGANTYVPLIGTVGVAGGIGFNATGNIDVHSDTLMASILSQLPPEENPGQETAFTGNVNGIETGANVQGFDINDYIAFKAAGIAALRIDDGVAIFQSGVTSVDPGVYPQLVRISRRRMADYIEDSIALSTKQYGKKLSLQARRKALKSEIRGFMAGLLSKNNPGSQRIAGYSVTDSDGNDDVTLSSGMYRITVAAQTLASLDSIVVACTVGEDVDVSEILPTNA